MESNKQMPLVSAGMPVYNGAKTLRRALDSILAQDYTNFELIISDNASTDETPEICREYAARNSRIRYYRAEKNMGSVWNFNRVFELASGKYFMWAAHDDHRASSYISKCVTCMEVNPKAILCQTYTIAYIEGIRLPLFRSTLDSITSVPCPIKRYANILKYLPATAIYGLLRMEAIKKIKPFGNYISTDIVFTHELSLHDEFIQVPEELFFYYGRTKRRTPDEDYAVLRPGNKLSWRYIPFLVLACQHAASIIRSPLSFWQKARLLAILIIHNVRNLTTKLALRAAIIFRRKECPKWIAKIIDESMFNNPNIQRIMDESQIPFEHQRPSRQAFPGQK